MANKEPLIISEKEEMTAWSRSARSQGLKIGLVPTMGFLHEGHLSLVRESKKQADLVVVSIYLNPGQFSPSEDLSSYPSDFFGDIEKLSSVPGGVDVVFHPKNLYDYQKSEDFVKGGIEVKRSGEQEDGKAVSCVEKNGIGHETWVSVERLQKGLCGRTRPVFFRGVTTIVAKLFNIIEPDIAVFGKKDYQQLRIVEKMVRDLDFPVKVIGVELVRDEDGLAKSSRNVRLSPQERQEALSVSRSLMDAKYRAEEKGEVDCNKLADSVVSSIHEAGGKVDYAEIVEQHTLEPLEEINIRQGAVLCVAAWFGNVRLIDNIEITI